MVDNPPEANWVADMDINHSKRFQGSGTFACWLPENVEVEVLTIGGFECVAGKLDFDFRERFEKMETHYCAFFGIEQEDLEAHVEDVKRALRS